jgi:hypothetical protein
MGGEEGCENMKSDVASLGRKIKFHLLVYIIDMYISFKEN